MKKSLFILMLSALPMAVFSAMFGFFPPDNLISNPCFFDSGIYVPETVVTSVYEGGQWQIDNHLIIEYLPYHGNSPLISAANYYKEENNGLTLSSYLDFIYNSAELCREFTLWENDAQSGFTISQKGIFEYDDTNRITSYQMSYYSSSILQYQYKESYEYLADGSYNSHRIIEFDSYRQYQLLEMTLDFQRRLQTLTASISPDSLNWTMSNRYHYSYHSQDSSSIEDYIRLNSDNLATTMALGIGFGENTVMISEISIEFWLDSAWQNNHKNTYNYDSDNRLSSLITYSYQAYPDNPNQYFWTPSSRETYSYDEHGNEIASLRELYENGAYIPSRQSETSYSLLTSIEDDSFPAISPIQIKAYPLPFVDETNIFAESKAGGEIGIQIFNLKGQRLKSFTLRHGESCIWDGKDEKGNSLPSSLYFLRAEQNGFHKTQKLLKIK